MDKSPDAFRTISEVAEYLDTPAHVLRFWESRFPQIKPVKRAGGRRYYRPSDMALLTGIKRLLHDDGLTIRGVQKILREQGVRHVAGLGGQAGHDDDAPPHDSPVDIVADVIGSTTDVAFTADILPFDTMTSDHHADRDADHNVAAASELSPDADPLWPDAGLSPPDVDADLVPAFSEPVPAGFGNPVSDAASTPHVDAEGSAQDDDQFLALLAEVSKSENATAPLQATEDDATRPPETVSTAVLDTATEAAIPATAPLARTDDTWRSIPLAQGEEMPLASRLRAMPAGALAPRAPQIAAWISRARDLTQRMSEPARPGRD